MRLKPAVEEITKATKITETTKNCEYHCSFLGGLGEHCEPCDYFVTCAPIRGGTEPPPRYYREITKATKATKTTKEEIIFSVLRDLRDLGELCEQFQSKN